MITIVTFILKFCKMLALIRDSFIEQTLLIHLMLPPICETFFTLDKNLLTI